MRARDNPFATVRTERLSFRLPGLTWEELLNRFDHLGRRAALVGSKGSGKTTLLGQIEARLRQRGFETVRLQLTETRNRFPPGLLVDLAATMTSRHVVLLDGAEQLGYWRWLAFKRCFRRATGLLVSAHRPGLLPTLLECRTSPALLAGLVEELLNGESRISDADADARFERHRGNLREALRELYDELSLEPAGDPAAAVGAEA